MIAVETALRAFEDKEEIYASPVEHAVVINPAGEVIVRKQGNENSVTFYNNEMLLMKDCVLTHNHPTNITLSSPDVDMAIITNMKEVRATCKSGTYILRRPKNGWNEKVDMARARRLVEVVLIKGNARAKREGNDVWDDSAEVVMHDVWKLWAEEAGAEYIYVPRRRSY
jgi:(2Fe-2S) ferredoxin